MEMWQNMHILMATRSQVRNLAYVISLLTLKLDRAYTLRSCNWLCVVLFRGVAYGYISSIILHCSAAVVLIYQSYPTATQCNALHLKLKWLHYHNAVVGIEMEIQVLKTHYNAELLHSKYHIYIMSVARGVGVQHTPPNQSKGALFATKGAKMEFYEGV